jgi:hypothetical protein
MAKHVPCSIVRVADVAIVKAAIFHEEKLA